MVRRDRADEEAMRVANEAARCCASLAGESPARRVVVATRPRDSITLAERRTRGAAAYSMTRRLTRHARLVSGPTGDTGRVVSMSTMGVSNSFARKGASKTIVRSCCLEAVLGKTRRTEF